MASTSPRRRTAETLATASWLCASLLSFALLLSSLSTEDTDTVTMIRGRQLISRACNEIYVVGEGETLHTISEKCGDNLIVEQNPHIHDPDDVFPGLVIKITPFSNYRNK